MGLIQERRSSNQTWIVDDPEAVAHRAADHIVYALEQKPDLLLCAATGGSPTRTYEMLVERHRQTPALFEKLRVIKLDEWGGVPMDHPGTCETYLQEKLIGPLGITADRYISFRSDAEPLEECDRVFHALWRWGRIDLCILGLGMNGHLALNEPAAVLQSLPHRAELAPSSQQHPMIRDSKTRITYGLTLGMSDILHSRDILLLVHGNAKAGPYHELFSRRISTQFPASFLWLHPQWICIVDRAAEGSPQSPG
jgi:galactosamine-6-phosphate isomerase